MFSWLQLYMYVTPMQITKTINIGISHFLFQCLQFLPKNDFHVCLQQNKARKNVTRKNSLFILQKCEEGDDIHRTKILQCFISLAILFTVFFKDADARGNTFLTIYHRNATSTCISSRTTLVATLAHSNGLIRSGQGGKWDTDIPAIVPLRYQYTSKS